MPQENVEIVRSQLRVLVRRGRTLDQRLSLRSPWLAAAAVRLIARQRKRHPGRVIRSSTMRVEESIEIACSPEAVWAVVSDPMNDARWCHKVKSVKPAGEHQWEVMHKPVPLQAPTAMRTTQHDCHEPTRLTLDQEDETSTFRVQYVLEPSATGTVFTQISEFEWKTLPRVLHGTFARGVRRDVQRQLRDLKQLLEH